MCRKEPGEGNLNALYNWEQPRMYVYPFLNKK
jgi:hypothetical protein